MVGPGREAALLEEAYSAAVENSNTVFNSLLGGQIADDMLSVQYPTSPICLLRPNLMLSTLSQRGGAQD